MASQAGRTAIVTGVSGEQRGIGRGIAEALAAQGVSILIADVSSSVFGVAAELRAANPGVRIEAHEGDLSSQKGAQALVTAAMQAFGRIDILVNNAGGGVIRPFLEHDEASFTQTLARNLWTAIWCTHTVLPHMVAQNHGRIVNVGADSLRTGIPQHAGYNAAKGGVVGMMVGLATEFARYDITVNTVSPCIVETERVRNADPKRRALFIDGVIPKGRGAKIEEVADAVCFLAGREAAFITGQEISVNGGSAMP